MLGFPWRKQREVEFATLAGSPPGTPANPADLARQPSDTSLAGSSGELSGDEAGTACEAAGASGSRVVVLERPLAARGGGGSSGGVPAEAASVRQKAQYFEALIRSNTDTLVRCASTEVRHTLSCPGVCWGEAEPGGGDADMGEADSDSDAADQWQDYSEVQLVLRMPRPAAAGPAPPAAHPQYGSVDDMAALIERLQSQLQLKEREKQLTASALQRKSQECDNLMRVVRELADSRAKVVSTKASLQEKYAELQAEFHRMLRIAELARTVSKENLAKTSRTQKALRQTEDELHSTRKQAAHLQTKSKKLKTENCELKEKLNLLQRLDCFEGTRESACMREFRSRICETY